MARNQAATRHARADDQPASVPGPRQDDDAPRLRRQDSPGGSVAGQDTLAWSVTAMSGALRRLAAARAGEMPLAVAAATEAVWWATVASSAMSRARPAAYGHALAALDPAERRAVDRSLAALRFIRSQLGQCSDPADFIEPQPAPAREWTWSTVPPPPPQRGRARDAGPYRDYRAQLAGRPVAEALGRVAGFLSRACATAGRPGQ